MRVRPAFFGSVISMSGRILALRDIVGNLWYCYVSRKMWEMDCTDCFGQRVGYSFFECPEFRFRLMPMVLSFWAAFGVLWCRCSGFGKYLLAGAIMAVPYLMCHVVDYLIQKSKPTALYYAKMKLGKVQPGQGEEPEVEKNTKESCCSFAKRVGNKKVHSVRPCSLEDGLDDGEDFFAVGSVAGRKRVLKGAGEAGEGKGVQKSVVALAEKSGAGEVCEDAGGEDSGLFQAVGRAEASALKGAFAAEEEKLSDDHCRACNLENGDCRLLFLAKRHLSGRPVEDGEGDGVRELVHGGARRNGKERAQEKICDCLGVLQDDHLWTEFGRLGRVLLLLTAPLWVPMALISGGFRAAAPFGSEGCLRSFFEETYFFSFVSGVCFLVARLFAACC